MPNTYQKWIKSHKKGQTRFTAADVTTLRDFAQALDDLRANAVNALGGENQSTKDLSEMSRNILSLAQQSSDLAFSADVDAANNKANADINADEAIRDDAIDLVNDILNEAGIAGNAEEGLDEPIKEEDAPTVRKWEEAVMFLSGQEDKPAQAPKAKEDNEDKDKPAKGLDKMFDRDFKQLLEIGVTDPDAPKNVNMQDLYNGLDLLNSMYGITTDVESIRKTYDDRQKAIQPSRILPELAETYDDPIYPDQYFDAIDFISSGIDELHSTHVGLKFDMLQFSSPEHDALLKSADRLKKAFANTDFYDDPEEKLAALDDALAKAKAYRRKKREDAGVELDDEDAKHIDEDNLTDEEKEAAWYPRSDAGIDRYSGAKKIIQAANLIKHKLKSKLRTAKADLKFAKKNDPALKNNRAIWDELDAIDPDLNAKRDSGWFSGSSTEHQQLKDSVDELRLALDPKNVVLARQKKLDALKKVKAQALNYIGKKSEDPGSEMGKKRLSAAKKLLNLANKEIAVVENAMNCKKTSVNDFHSWEKLFSNSTSPVYKSKHKEIDKLTDFASFLNKSTRDYLPGSDDELTAVMNEASPSGIKARSLFRCIIDADSLDREVWYSNREQLRVISKAMNDTFFKDMFKACTTAQNEMIDYDDNDIDKYSDAFIEVLELSNKHYGTDFPVDRAKTVFAQAEQELQDRRNKEKESVKAQKERMDEWSEKYPCSPLDAEDFEITDPDTLTNIEDLAEFGNAIKYLDDEAITRYIDEHGDAQVRDRYREIIEGLKAAAYTGDDLESRSAQTEWNNLMITVRDFKEFLAEGDNYNLVIRAAEEATKAGAKKYEDYTNYRKCLYDTLTGLNKFHNADIEVRDIDISPVELDVNDLDLDVPDDELDDNKEIIAGAQINSDDEDEYDNAFEAESNIRSRSIISPNKVIDLNDALKQAQENIRDMYDKENDEAPSCDDIDNDLKTILAVHVLRKVSDEKTCTHGELEQYKNNVKSMGEYAHMKTFEDDEKIYSDAVEGNGGRLYDTFMKQRKIMKDKDEHIVKDDVLDKSLEGPLMNDSFDNTFI